MILRESDFVEFLKRQYPDEEVGWTGPGTWALFIQYHLKVVLRLWDECEFYYFDLDGTKIFMSPFAQEGSITFNGGSNPITGLEFVSI